MESLDLTKLSSRELKELLAKKKEEERKNALAKRDAYEGIRADLLFRMEQKVRQTTEVVHELHKFCVEEMDAFYHVLEEYGQLKMPGQLSFRVEEKDFRVEVRRNKVKRFDERADVAAARLIEFLQMWISGKEDGVDNPMYQLAMTLLERNKNGDLDYKSISKLYELEAKFDDPEYSEIMNLFKESHLVEGTSTNFYFFERDTLGVWRKLEPSFNRM